MIVRKKYEQKKINKKNREVVQVFQKRQPRCPSAFSKMEKKMQPHMEGMLWQRYTGQLSLFQGNEIVTPTEIQIEKTNRLKTENAK
jgi:hypothetical protein